MASVLELDQRKRKRNSYWKLKILVICKMPLHFLSLSLKSAKGELEFKIKEFTYRQIYETVKTSCYYLHFSYCDRP